MPIQMLPAEMLQIAAYALIVGFFLLFGLLLVWLVYPYTEEKPAPLSSAAQQAHQDLKNQTKQTIADCALALGLFLLVSLLVLVMAKKEAPKERQERLLGQGEKREVKESGKHERGERS